MLKENVDHLTIVESNQSLFLQRVMEAAREGWQLGEEREYWPSIGGFSSVSSVLLWKEKEKAVTQKQDEAPQQRGRPKKVV